LDFDTSSLSKNNAKLPFVVIAFAFASKRMGVLRYMFGHTREQ